MSVESPLTTTEVTNRRIEIDTHGSIDPFAEHDELDNFIESKEASGNEVTIAPLQELSTRALAEAMREPILGTEDQALADDWKVTEK